MSNRKPTIMAAKKERMAPREKVKNRVVRIKIVLIGEKIGDFGSFGRRKRKLRHRKAGARKRLPRN